MLKVSTFFAESEYGLAAVPLFGAADTAFEKVASAGLLPEVVSFIESLRPRTDSQYVLVNAMGAGEYYSSNINGDHFEETGLIHKPDGWSGNPLLDKQLAKNWDYGFPTFYNAHPFAHHRNKDPSRAYGEVVLAVWNDHMKRVELVVRLDLEKCVRFGGTGVWDRLKEGQFPDVSMGSRVPFDLSSINTDWDAYKKALATFNPKKHRHPGLAVVEVHKRLKAKDGVGIKGVSITRNDYDEWTKNHMNRILPDGRKVFVYNPFPRFFDISFVFIGADKTAKVMVFIVRCGGPKYVSSANAAEKLGYDELATERLEQARAGGEKTASVSDELLKSAFFGKSATQTKKSEIKKEVPSQLAPAAIPLMTRCEKDLPGEALQALSSVPEGKALSTLTGMGIVLRPREFQRVSLMREGKGQLADEMSALDRLFPKSKETTPLELNAADFMPALARMMMQHMPARSGLGPFVEKRVVILDSSPKPTEETATSHPDESLRKMGAAYNGYRQSVMEAVAHTQELLGLAALPADTELLKLASAPVEEVFTPLAFNYLKYAFADEATFAVTENTVVQPSGLRHSPAWRGVSPSRNT